MHHRLLLLCLCTLTCLPAAEREADHAALRGLMKALTVALNAGDFAAFSAQLAPGFHLTFADQRVFTSVDALSAYHHELSTAKGITQVQFAPEVDGPAQFLDETTGICTGRSTDTFTSAAGAITIPSRWTATVVRDQAGAWKLATFHSGVDLLDNPVLERTRSALMRLVWLAGAVAAALGLVAGLLIGRRTRV